MRHGGGPLDPDMTYLPRYVLTLLALTALASCTDNARAPWRVRAPEAWQPVVDDFMQFSELDRLPATTEVTIREGNLCSECYEVESERGQVEIRAGGILGAQYGLAHWLESRGVRFVHPNYAHVPGRVVRKEGSVPDTGALEGSPQIARRGLHLHTLHPIETLASFWTDEGDIEDAKRVIDWVVKNRGNYLTWPALDDIDDPARHAAWHARTKQIIEYGHTRGLKFSIGVQLFASGNLQRAFHLVDLADTSEDDLERVLRERLDLLADLGLDELGVSFGEFFQEDPARFIELANRSSQIAIDQLSLDAVHATIHVGEDLRTDYMDENLIYYFLIKHVPNVTPWVHTVMYYNLTDPASGAYHHDNFHEHRDFLYEKIRAGEEVTYFPESAYWIAFDNSVPLYLPLYPYSRWLDLKQTLDATGGLPTGHVIFSSGWEWGYWQTDLLALQASYALPDTFEAQVETFWSAWGADEAASKLMLAMAEAQHTYLLGEELGGYLAGWDTVLNIGALANIVSQPLVTRVHRLARAEQAERDGFSETTLAALLAFAAAQQEALDDFREATKGLDLQRVMQELRDGAEVTTLRARYVATLYQAAVLGLDGGQGQLELLEDAAELREEAQRWVSARHGRLFAGPSSPLIDASYENPTIYPYGYLWPADALCYWDREMIELKNQLGLSSDTVPDCTVIDLGL